MRPPWPELVDSLEPQYRVVVRLMRCQRHGILASRRPQQRLPHEPDGTRQVPLHDGSRNAQHGVAGPDELLFPATVREDAGAMVDVAVHFHDQADFASKEVHNVVADDLLTAKRKPQALAPKS